MRSNMTRSDTCAWLDCSRFAAAMRGGAACSQGWRTRVGAQSRSKKWRSLPRVVSCNATRQHKCLSFSNMGISCSATRVSGLSNMPISCSATRQKQVPEFRAVRHDQVRDCSCQNCRKRPCSATRQETSARLLMSKKRARLRHEFRAVRQEACVQHA